MAESAPEPRETIAQEAWGPLGKAIPIAPKDPSSSPLFLQGPTSRRGAEEAHGPEQDLLGANFVEVQQAFQLGATLREAQGEVDPLAGLPDDQVVLVELEDGGIAVGTAAELRSRPELNQGPGELEGATRGLEALVGRLFALSFGDDALIKEVKAKLAKQMAERFGKKITQVADLGLSYLGTKLLLEAIEARLPVDPGLYRWNGGEISAGHRVLADEPILLQAAQKGILVFIHGTGSCTHGSFGDLATTVTSTWEVLQSRFKGHLYGFEHRTFSESPIENALQLAQALPKGAHLHLVTHSRGGLVGDLLCLETIDDSLIERFRYSGNEGGLLGEQRKEAQDIQQQQLRQLRTLLAQKGFCVERYVRVACPARGTKLLGTHLDLFLSGLLSLVGMVPLLAGNPVYTVLKRVVLELVKRRTHPALVPGLAAMLPDSPLGALLAQAPLRKDLKMATIAGRCEGANPLQKVALLLGDALFFQRCANDLVVDTASMQAGIALQAEASTLVEQAKGVNHFHYFQRPTTNRSLGRWLSESKVDAISDFLPLSKDLANRERNSTRQSEQAEATKASRDSSASKGGPHPVAVLIPDLLASHLWRPQANERVWFDPANRSIGPLSQLVDIHDLEIEAEKVLEVIYGDLCRLLEGSHRVERFAYDWRQPLEVSAEQLVARLRELLRAPELADQPVRLLAHGMGGLVVRGLIARAPELWQQLMGRKGARLILLGSPIHGSFHMVATLIGHSELIRQLARIDPDGALQAQLDAMALFPGALQLLPQPGWKEEETSEPLPFGAKDWYDEALWSKLKEGNRDTSFGDGLAATPTKEVLAKGRWLWDQNQEELFPNASGDPKQVIVVNGKAPLTPCGLTLKDGHPVVLGTHEGDGMVTWRSAAIGGTGNTYLMEADHGNLPCSQEFFPALVELLSEGSTKLLQDLPAPSNRPRRPILPEPAPWPSDEELLRGLVGGQTRTHGRPEAMAALQVSCHAMDLRFINCPVMVGHYEQDPIAGAEAVIDQSVVNGELSSRERLGVYAGAVGTATVVLMHRDQQELHQGRCRGAVVIGLGKLGDLSVPNLLEAVQGGTLRYLLQIVDRHGANQVGAVNVELATLLLGQNSCGAISIDDSVTSLVKGVLNANEQFHKAFPRLSVRVGSLKIVEVFLDTAIAATRALRSLEKVSRDNPPQFEVDKRLNLGEGWRHRLDATQAAGYWPRLLVLGKEETGSPPGSETSAPGKLKVKLAHRLQYAFLGERARAEKVPHELQGELVEELVANSIHQSNYNPHLSRTLFQLLVPTPFKDVARRLDQLVLVLDDTTANLPWELLMADDKPMALQLAVVRQLQSLSYRQRVRQSPDRNAYVIGNPATTNFYRVFAGQPAGNGDGLASLSGASDEANAVKQILSDRDYKVEESIEDLNGVDVINKLYQKPYRVLHIAAHGVFEQLTREGERRSGVVLANGMLITVGEIEAMEVVPDLVFLNCCHLGSITTTPFNRLAASVATQLIEMGVRAVVACGWAVDDKAAVVFAQTFYKQMLANKRFGDAVFEARKRAFEAAPNSNTWGAYQAYGDPAFLLEVSHDGFPQSHAKPEPNEDPRVTPLELVAQFQQLRIQAEETIQRRQASDELLGAQLNTLRESTPPSWRHNPEVAIALADATAALGRPYREQARTHYLEAIHLHRGDNALPVRAIEQLATLEAQLGREGGDLPMIELALKRMEALFAILPAEAPKPPVEGEPAGVTPPMGWFTLKGSIQQMKAALLASQWMDAKLDGPTAGPSPLNDALKDCLHTYALAGPDPDAQIQGLTLQALQLLGPPGEGPSARAAAPLVREATALLEDLEAAFAQDRTFHRGLRAAEACLALKLLTGTLAEAGAKGSGALQSVRKAYNRAFGTCPASAKKRDSALDKLEVLETLIRALGLADKGGSGPFERAAGQVSRLRQSLQEEGLGSEDTEVSAEEEDEGVVMVPG